MGPASPFLPFSSDVTLADCRHALLLLPLLLLLLLL